MMTIDGFMTRLTERYGKPKNDQFTADIHRYLEDARPDFNQLYDIISDHHEYESFPNRAKVKGLWEKFGNAPAKFSSRATQVLTELRQLHEKWNRFDVKKIRDMYSSIVKKPNKEMWEMEFLHRWDLVSYHWERLTDEKAPESTIRKYCEAVKSSIIAGETFIDSNDEYTETVNMESLSDDNRKCGKGKRAVVKAGVVIDEIFQNQGGRP